MDIYILISVLSAIYSWIFCTVTSAPTGQSPTASTGPLQRRHVRNKRCSCATFLDNECVYFCHLDIIWVNTPERVVSYGIGNAPRTRRAVSDSMATSSSGPRCRCFSLTDTSCRDFCGLESSVLGYETPPDAVIRSAEGHGCAGARCKHRQAANTDSTKRMWSSKGRVSPLAVQAALRTRLLLEKWRVRQRHRARAREGESTAS